MKTTTKYLLLMLVALFTASCMDGDWDEPMSDESPFGNNELTETNIVTIGELKTKYAAIISSSDTIRFTEDIKIKGVVTANDIEGNIYNEVSVDDGTGAVLICISQGGIYGYLPVGQEILISLKDLYLGAYSKQPEIGTPYTNKNGRTYVSRMSVFLWQTHFKLLGNTTVTPMEFDKTKLSDSEYMTENCGKLMTIKNVAFQQGGKASYSSIDERDAANCVNRSLVGIATGRLVVRTSAYADFAADILPTGNVNITGIFTRYNNLWQVLIRQASDVQPAE